MNHSIQIVFGLLGGLALFIFGMNMMSECLQKAAGEKMRAILALLTKNPLLGVLAGALTTAVLQSSSAATVMAIGFVSAGLMSLPQAVSIILGANIGTTITAQIIAFKITDYIYVFLFLGFLFSFFSKSEKVKNIGQTIFAFGLLFLGIETMGSVMKPLASSPVFTDMIGKVAHVPVLGVALGTVMTVVVQSSSATIAVLQNFAAQAAADGTTSIIGLTGAIPILLGDNIGTTITALFACVGQSRDAKRTALAHCVFNISGSILFIWLVKPYAALIRYLSPDGPEVEVISRQIANAHTGFNLIMTLLWLPMIGLLVKIVTILIPDGEEGAEDIAKPRFLDDKLIGQPAVALKLVAQEIMRCCCMMENALQRLADVSSKEKQARMEEVMTEAEAVQGLGERITDYLANLFAAGVLTEEQAGQTAGMMYVLGDVERLAALCGNIAVIFREQKRKGKKTGFSKEALKDLEKSLTLISQMYAGVVKVMETGEIKYVHNMHKRREKIMELDLRMRKDHMKRIRDGKCKAGLTKVYHRILRDIDRMSNSCVNLADAVRGTVDFSYFIA